MIEATPHASLQPSPWISRFSPMVPPGASVLDVACGRGRHMHWFAQRGHPVTGVDRDAEALAAARAHMIATLNSFREALVDLGGGLGVTDPISGPVVLSVK